MFRILSPGTESIVPLAPLASVEDLSRFTTPKNTPSPRPRLRWGPKDVRSSVESMKMLPSEPEVEAEKEAEAEAEEPPAEKKGLDEGEVQLQVPKAPPPVEKPPWKGPPDRLNLVYLTLVLHGIGTLMPWNMFITAKDYFVNHKLSKSYTGIESEYATNFLPYIGFAAQIPNVIFNWLNIFIHIGGTLTTRIVWSILIEVCVFILTVILAMIDSRGWPGVFFWVTIGTVVILNMANGIYQNTVYGMAAKLPFKYTGAVVLGSNISGTFAAVINIVSIAMAPNARTAAIYYFITALFILLACFDTYFALPLNRFCRYHEHMNQKQQLMQRKETLTGVKSCPPYWYIFRKCFPQCFNVFMVFFVTLSIFPAVHSDVKMLDENFIIPKKFFTAVTCFLTFNIFAMMGNILPTFFTWPKPRWLWIPVTLRILLIPFFIFCNYQPYNIVRGIPVLVSNDWAYWIMAMFLGISSGYFSSLAMMYCPRTVEPQYASTAGMFGAASLVTGIFAGINFSFLMPTIVKNIVFEI